MELTEREPFSALLMAIGELYGKSLSAYAIKLYWQILKPFAWQDVAKAFERHVEDADTGQFLPKPADVIRVIEGTGQSKSLQAWTKVEQAIRQVGPYRSVVFDDPVIHAVLAEMGGWIKICQTSTKELPFVAKEFQTRCASYRYRAPTVFPKYFTGLVEHQNVQLGIA